MALVLSIRAHKDKFNQLRIEFKKKGQRPYQSMANPCWGSYDPLFPFSRFLSDYRRPL